MRQTHYLCLLPVRCCNLRRSAVRRRRSVDRIFFLKIDTCGNVPPMKSNTSSVSPKTKGSMTADAMRVDRLLAHNKFRLTTAISTLHKALPWPVVTERCGRSNRGRHRESHRPTGEGFKTFAERLVAHVNSWRNTFHLFAHRRTQLCKD